jgi:hypothetical protein
MYTLAIAGRKLARKQGESKRGRTKTNACGLDSGCRVSDKSMLTCFASFVGVNYLQKKTSELNRRCLEAI